MNSSVVIIGAGGFGRETLDVVLAASEAGAALTLRGVIDAAPSDENLARLEARGVSYLGTESDWLAGDDPALFLIGVGDPRLRREIANRWSAAGRRAAVAVHPSAGLGSACSVAPGSVVCAGVQVSTNVILGRHVHLNPNSTIGHDAVLSDFVSVNPGATISGDVLIGEGALIGAAAVVLQRLTVGAGAVVGAAACVVRDVPPLITVKGVPARGPD